MKSLEYLRAIDDSQHSQALGDYLRHYNGLPVESEPQLVHLLEADDPGGESYIVRLGDCFVAADDTTKSAMRRAITSLHADCHPDLDSKSYYADVLTCIGLFLAQKAVPTMVNHIGAGAWGAAYPDLVENALAVLQMFVQTEVGDRATQRLVGSPNFRDRYVFEACKLLIANHPETWSRELVHMLPRLRMISGQLSENDGERGDKQVDDALDDLAWFVFDAVPLPDIARGLDDSLLTAPLDRWLASLLSEKGPLQLVDTGQSSNDTGDRLVIVSRMEPARHQTIRLPGSVRAWANRQGLLEAKAGTPATPTLVGSTNSRPGSLFEACKLLIANPQEAMSWELVRALPQLERIADQLSKHQDGSGDNKQMGEALDDLAWFVFGAVPLADIARGLDSSLLKAPLDRWLACLLSQDGPLRLVDTDQSPTGTSDSFAIISRQGRALRQTIRLPEKFQLWAMRRDLLGSESIEEEADRSSDRNLGSNDEQLRQILVDIRSPN